LTGIAASSTIALMVDPFVRRQAGGIAYYTSRALDAIRGVRHAFSTRLGGVSPLPSGALNLSAVSWDSAENVGENRRRFLGAVGLEPASLVTVAQIHSDRVVMIEDSAAQRNRARLEGDSLVTILPGVTLGIRVADCFPILAASDDGAVVGNAHAGWRGTAGRIGAKTIAAMARAGALEPDRMEVAIGPGIRACCFEVGPEVAEVFEAGFAGAVRPHPAAAGKFLIDLPRALRAQLEEAGVASARIHDLGACTRCRQEELFSYRGEGPVSGRLMAVISRV
jgi:YfiH family protein